jgi:drug/metabolite transporter (DMT)-like permease
MLVMPMSSSAAARPSLIGISVGMALAALFVGALAMGISPVFVRNAEVGPFASAFWRVALALPVLFLWARLAREETAEAPTAGSHRALIFWHLAIGHTSIANATFFACLAPFWVAVLSRFTIGESVPRQTVIGLAICLPGAGLLIFHSASDGGGNWIGDLYGIATSFFFGLYFLVMRGARRHFGAGAATLRSTLVTALALLVAAVISGEAFLPDTLTGAANLLALGVVSHAGGQGLLSIALGVLSASFSSLVIFVEAVAAALFAWIFAGEPIGALQMAGGVLILFGLWIARPRATPKT